MMARSLRRDTPMWLVLSGWPSCVLGGASLFYIILWWTVVENAGMRPVLGMAAPLAALGLIWRGLWHRLVLMQDGRQLYNHAAGGAFLLAGMAVLWGGLSALFPPPSGAGLGPTPGTRSHRRPR